MKATLPGYRFDNRRGGEMTDDERNELDEQRAGGTQVDEEDAASKAQAAEEEHDEAKQEMEKLEEDPPENLEDWPDGKAKYETLGGPEGTHTYEEGPEKNLGPSGVRHHEDGSVTIDGEKVDNPDDYKGDPIPGGPTDPNTPDVGGEKDENKENQEREQQDAG
jgi:hypothetical protein